MSKVNLDFETGDPQPLIGCMGHMITRVEVAAVCCRPAFLWREVVEAFWRLGSSFNSKVTGKQKEKRDKN